MFRPRAWRSEEERVQALDMSRDRDIEGGGTAREQPWPQKGCASGHEVRACVSKYWSYE